MISVVPGAGLLAAVNHTMQLLVTLILSEQNWELKVVKILNAGKCESVSFIFSLFLSNGGGTKFNQKPPMLLSNYAIVTSKNQGYLFGTRGQEST